MQRTIDSKPVETKSQARIEDGTRTRQRRPEAMAVPDDRGRGNERMQRAQCRDWAALRAPDHDYRTHARHTQFVQRVRAEAMVTEKRTTLG
jgi:hypothetical protein